MVEYRVSGPPGGTPLVFHHGTPGAVTPFRFLERAAHQRGLRLLTFSRPGYGGSSRLPGRSVAEVVADTAALLGTIGADRCLVAGWSGGGPHALACAARLEAAAGVLVIAGVAPYAAARLDWMAGMGDDNLAEFGAAMAGEADLGAFLAAARHELKDASVEGIVSSMASLLPEVDKAVLSEEFGEDMAASLRDGLRTGIDGWLDDDLAFIKPWGFDLDEISRPVTIWQGSADLMVPFSHGHWLAEHVPGARAHLNEGDGHLSVGIGAVEAMLDELVALGNRG